MHLGARRPDEHVAQAHGSEEAVGAAHAGIRRHDKGVALHEGPQVQLPREFLRAQAAQHALLVLLRPDLVQATQLQM